MHEERRWYDLFFKETAEGTYVVFPWGAWTRGYEIRDPARVERMRRLHRRGTYIFIAAMFLGGGVTSFLAAWSEISRVPAFLVEVGIVGAAVAWWFIPLKRAVAGAPRVEKRLSGGEALDLLPSKPRTVPYLLLGVGAAILLYVGVSVYDAMLYLDEPLLRSLASQVVYLGMAAVFGWVGVHLLRRDPSAEHDERAHGTGRE